MGFDTSRRAFRALLQGTGLVRPASVFDPASIRIAESLGFACAILAGSTASLAVLAAPDLIVLTLSEFADLATRVTRAAALPLLVDADHGYGNAQNVIRTVVELERAGVSAMTIEDTELPTRFGGGKPVLVSRAEAEGKLRAALAARTDPATSIVGRTSLAFSDLDEAVARSRLFAETGVDALFFTGVSSFEELRALRDASSLPFILGGGPLTDAAALSDLGVRVALAGHQPIQAAFKAVHDTMLALRDGTTLPELAGPALVATVTRAEDYAKAARDFMA